MEQMTGLTRICLNLARSKEFPDGSAARGYIFVAPLDAAGHIDAERWKVWRAHCDVLRFWEGEPDQHGRLVHKSGGADHARWMFDYDARRDDDDEAGYRFGSHRLTPGAYVSVSDKEGTSHTFKVVSVEPVTKALAGKSGDRDQAEDR